MLRAKSFIQLFDYRKLKGNENDEEKEEVIMDHGSDKGSKIQPCEPPTQNTFINSTHFMEIKIYSHFGIYFSI